MKIGTDGALGAFFESFGHGLAVGLGLDVIAAAWRKAMRQVVKERLFMEPYAASPDTLAKVLQGASRSMAKAGEIKAVLRDPRLRISVIAPGDVFEPISSVWYHQVANQIQIGRYVLHGNIADCLEPPKPPSREIQIQVALRGLRDRTVQTRQKRGKQLDREVRIMMGSTNPY